MGNFITFRERIEHKVGNHPALSLRWAAQTAIIRKGTSDENRIFVTLTKLPCRVDIMQSGMEARKQEWWQLEERLAKLAGGQ